MKLSEEEKRAHHATYMRFFRRGKSRKTHPLVALLPVQHMFGRMPQLLKQLRFGSAMVRRATGEKIPGSEGQPQDDPGLV